MPSMPGQYIFPYMIPVPIYNMYPSIEGQRMYNMYPYPFGNNQPMYNAFPYPMWDNPYPSKRKQQINLIDYGEQPLVINIDDAVKQNENFRTALWTGDHLQITLMEIEVGDDIGLEVHNTGEQVISIVEGNAMVQMGDTQDNLNYQKRAFEGDIILIPVGKWHNITNMGNEPLKLYAIYAPPQHPQGTVEQTKSDEEFRENRYRYRY